MLRTLALSGIVAAGFAGAMALTQPAQAAVVQAGSGIVAPEAADTAPTQVGYYGGYYGGYYRGYYAPYYAPYYDGYYDPALAVSPVYGTTEPAAPRSGQPVPQAAAPAEPIFYPRNGQSAEATESDRRECNRWATTQRGAMDDASIFQRATFACMEGRGYTAR